MMYADQQRLGTRERLLSLLHEGKTITVAGLSRAWGLTRADIRYHLTLLVQEGMAEIIPRDLSQPARRGRPVLRYQLAANLAPNNLPTLCSALLDMLIASQSEDQRIQTLQTLALYLVGEQPVPELLTQRPNLTIMYLNRHTYHARWEASPAGPRILLRNCPYAAIIDRHPELCQFDRLLVDQLARLTFQQTSRIDRASGSPSACVFDCR